MKKNLFYVLCTLFIGTSFFNATAGPKDDPSVKLPFNKKMKWANGLYKQGSFYTAEDYYMQLKKEQPRNPFITYMAAECAWQTRDYATASRLYGEAYALAPEIYPEAPFKEGMMLKMNGQYEEAIDRFQYYIDNFKKISLDYTKKKDDNKKASNTGQRKILDKKYKIYAQRHIDGCIMAIKSMENPVPAYIKNAGPNVNTVNTELSPLPLGDTALLFATMSQNSIIQFGKDKRKDYVSRLMWSPKEFDRTRIKDTFEVAMKFDDGKFNDPRTHVGNGSWSPGGDRFYFTKCYESDTLKIKCKIYVSKFTKGIWGTPKELDGYINDPESSNTQPYCTMIGKKEVLYFSSNRRMQSAGGYDIWYSVYDSKAETYRRPQNCGKKINSYGNEGTPFYDTKNNKLYFSSDGWITIGGYDIFSADGGPTRYTNLHNLGYPINSSADDLYYVQDQGKKDNAYIVSNRLGSYYAKNPTCCDDIWRVIKEPNFYVKGIVIDENTNEQINQVVIKLNDENGKSTDTFNSKSGNFLFYTPMGKTFSINADKTGYLSGRTVVSTLDKTVMDPDDTTSVTIYMSKIGSNSTFHVRNIYYNFNDGKFQPDSYSALDSLVNFMRDNPSISVEIRSYTDEKGEDSYNNDLSVKRAQAVLDYLSAKGVERSRMIARGEGEKNPIAPNKNGNKDNPVGRQYNRRTEFRIIGDLPEKRIIYDQNKPEYIDKTGTDRRNENLRINTGDDKEGDPKYEEVPAEIQPGTRINE